MGSFLARALRRRVKRPWHIRTLTLGVREHVYLTGQLLPLIEWRWWCRGWRLRSVWLGDAVKAATEYYRWEVGADEAETISGGMKRVGGGPSLAPQRDRSECRATACEFALVLGGRPAEWREVRWRDARYMWDLHFWRETPPDKRGARPVWGRR